MGKTKPKMLFKYFRLVLIIIEPGCGDIWLLAMVKTRHKSARPSTPLVVKVLIFIINNWILKINIY